MMRRATERAGLALPLWLFLGSASHGLAQDRISVDVNLVVLHVTTTDSKGLSVSGLDARDFQVYDDGKLRPVTFFSHEDIPVTVGLVVDHSGSMRPKIADVIAAGEIFARASNPADQIFVVNFNDRVLFGLPSDDFTADPETLRQAISAARTAGKTAFYDALSAAFQQVRKGSRDKKVLIVISDGGDNASRATLPRIMQAARESDAIIYSIGLFNEDDPDRNPRVLQNLAQATGGEAFLLKTPAQIKQVCTRIAKDIRSQYTLGFAAAPGSGWHTIRVVANAPHRGRLRVRTRTGYFPAKRKTEGL